MEAKMNEIILLTGPSGSGKTTAQHVFEESGYYVIDNIFSSTFEHVIKEVVDKREQYPKLLLQVSPRTACEIISSYKKKYTDIINSKIIVLDCKKDVLLKRFKLTRHVHPLVTTRKISLDEALDMDIACIKKIKDKADVIIDTTSLAVKDFRKILFEAISDRKKDNVRVRFISFGHKHNIPLDCDLTLDTRALPNPYWIPELRQFTGLDKPVKDYLVGFEETNQLLKNMEDYLSFYLEKVQEDGRGDYCVGICCTGGQHRSVFFAEQLSKYFSKKYETSVFHRDINKKEDQ